MQVPRYVFTALLWLRDQNPLMREMSFCRSDPLLGELWKIFCSPNATYVHMYVCTYTTSNYILPYELGLHLTTKIIVFSKGTRGWKQDQPKAS